MKKMSIIAAFWLLCSFQKHPLVQIRWVDNGKIFTPEKNDQEGVEQQFKELEIKVGDSLTYYQNESLIAITTWSTKGEPDRKPLKDFRIAVRVQ